MKNKKVSFLIVSIVLILVVFIISFIVGVIFLNIFENIKTKQNIITKNNDIKEQEKIKNEKDQEVNTEINSFEGIIMKIDKQDIYVQNPSHLVDYSIYEGDIKYHNAHSIEIDGKLYVIASYLLCLDDVPIKDSNGVKLNISDLKVGDIVDVFTVNLKYNESTISTPILSNYIQLIEKKNKS